MKIWEALTPVDPQYTKKVPLGGRRLTAINATYRFQRATEYFGPMGLGWGVEDEQYDFQQLGAEKHDTLCTYRAVLWYIDPESSETGKIQISADIWVWEYSRKYQEWQRQEDLFKKVQTDALTKGLSKIGMASEVFKGMWDDHKYMAKIQAQFSGQNGNESARRKLTKKLLEQAEPGMQIGVKEQGMTLKHVLEAFANKGFTLDPDMEKHVSDKVRRWAKEAEEKRGEKVRP